MEGRVIIFYIILFFNANVFILSITPPSPPSPPPLIPSLRRNDFPRCWAEYFNLPTLGFDNFPRFPRDGVGLDRDALGREVALPDDDFVGELGAGLGDVTALEEGRVVGNVTAG